MPKTYDAGSLEVLTGLDPVRKRPGMYTDTRNPNHLAQEVIDNAVDEAIEGHAKNIKVCLHEDSSLSVQDDGRGMPVDIHPEHKVNGVELILTRLHSGGKFSDKNYRYSGGLHGVGISVVNALSKRLEVVVHRNSQAYTMAFENGDPVTELENTGKVGKKNSGTRVQFWPDTSHFESPDFSLAHLQHLLRAKAVLCPGLKVEYSDEKAPKNNCSWQYQGGLAEHLSDNIGKALLNEPFTDNGTDKNMEVEWSMQWLDDDADNSLTESYVNLIPTSQGGSHVTGLRNGVFEAIKEFCELRNLLPRNTKLTADDVMATAVYVLSLRMQDPQFSGQTKERLSSRTCTPFIASLVRDKLSLWLHQHHEEAGRLAQQAIDHAQTRLRKSKTAERKKITHSGPALPGKLTDCVNSDIESTELFLVEGDSAGGSARQARDRKTQAIMPLRGKIRNTWEVSIGDLFDNEEVHNISIALGVEPGQDNLEPLRYGKVCVLADADSDGAHIATLIVALFLKHFRAIVEAGRVYIAMPPLYRLDIGAEIHYALDDKERDQLLKKLGKNNRKVSVQRFKGLGEMNAQQLRETSMAPDTRRLVQLRLGERDGSDKMLDMLLAKNSADLRKQWLEKKGNLAEAVS